MLTLMTPAAIKAAALAAVVALVFGLGWMVRGWKADAAMADLQIAIADANARTAAESTALKTKVIEAQSDARKREASLRAAADAAGSESDGLRNDLEGMRNKLDQLSREAAIERATAVSAVFYECSVRYKRLAEVADRHANDLRTLIDAWPK